MASMNTHRNPLDKVRTMRAAPQSYQFMRDRMNLESPYAGTMLPHHDGRVIASVSTDHADYRLCSLRSLGETTVANDPKVSPTSGWFSNRSATYLAAGRPVITQGTSILGELIASHLSRGPSSSLVPKRSRTPHRAVARNPERTATTSDQRGT